VTSADWEYNTADNYYYYIGGDNDGILAPANDDKTDETSPLFTHVKLKKDFNGTSDNLDLIVYAEVVQIIKEYDETDGKVFANAVAAFAALKGGD
jgi:hypothetical protein